MISDKNILVLKSKFFLYRIVTYFSFLLLPVWLQKTVTLPVYSILILMACYAMFIAGQWYLLAKEVDYRFKIFFKTNSSMDRLIYRLMMGQIIFILYFNALNFLPSKWIYNSFWITWVVLGLFYSWPTRGKIIKESVASNFGEFKYLDSFERTLVLLILALFVVSIPEIPKLNSFESLALFMDPKEKLSGQYWNFIAINYYPFFKYPQLMRYAIGMHFYVNGVGIFLLSSYALMRYFYSRRLSLLGVFAILSTWSFSKILATDPSSAIVATFAISWLWMLVWLPLSGTYRAGLFWGLMAYLGALCSRAFIGLTAIQSYIVFIFSLSGKTTWYKRQLVKYGALGIILSLFTFLLEGYEPYYGLSYFKDYARHVADIINRKAFFTLSFLGIFIIVFQSWIERQMSIGKFNKDALNNLLKSILVYMLFCVFFEKNLIESFFVMWFATFLALLPLEYLFQTLSRMRSNRNMIYLIYILICLLDSHVEGRIKILARILFNS